MILADDPKFLDRTGTQILDLANDSGAIAAFVAHAPFVAHKAVSVNAQAHQVKNKKKN